MKISWKSGFKVLAMSAALALAGLGTQMAGSLESAAMAAEAPAVVAAPPEPAEVVADISPVATPVAPARLAPTPGIGQPVDGQLYFQEQFSPVGQEAYAMMNYALMPVVYIITALVMSLLLWTIIRYRAAANPVPSRTSHNVTIEIIWTLLPALVLLFLAFPSFRLLANQYSSPKPDLTIKVTGNQWYWSYEYPDYGGVEFDSIILDEEEAKAEDVPYLLDVDNRLVVPTGAIVKVLIASNDVIHSFAIPSFWVKMDAVPGRINETWFRVERPGVYYGQCSEICGMKHGFMPIAVEARTPEDFRQWMLAQQAEAGIEPLGTGFGDTEANDSPAGAETPVADIADNA